MDDEFTASLCLVRSRETVAGSYRWKIRFDAGLRPDITVAIRMNQMNSAVLDYYVLPRFEMEADQIALAENNGLALDAYRFDTIDMLFELAARSQLMEVSYGIGSMH